MGASDDQLLELSYKVRDKLSSYFWANQPMSKMSHIYTELSRLYQGLQYMTPDSRYAEIYL